MKGMRETSSSSSDSQIGLGLGPRPIFSSNYFQIGRQVVLLHIQTDLGREISAGCYRQGRQLLLTFLTMVTRWSRSTSNFYALIGQNLTGELMRKIHAAS